MNRVTIIIIAFLLSISFTGNQPPQAQTAQKFKVAVLVDCENDNVKSLMESYIKGELRSLGDVQIVGNSFENALWQYMISLHATEPSYESGRKAGLLVVSYDFFEIVPYWHFNELKKREFEKSLYVRKARVNHCFLEVPRDSPKVWSPKADTQSTQKQH